MGLLEGLTNWNKQETGPLPKFTEQKLETAAKEYAEAAKALNALDLENDPDEKIVATQQLHNQKRDVYVNMHRELHPEAYLGDEKNVAVLPNIE